MNCNLKNMQCLVWGRESLNSAWHEEPSICAGKLKRVMYCGRFTPVISPQRVLMLGTLYECLAVCWLYQSLSIFWRIQRWDVILCHCVFASSFDYASLCGDCELCTLSSCELVQVTMLHYAVLCYVMLCYVILCSHFWGQGSSDRPWLDDIV